MVDLDTFLTELSSAAPVPGGGSVAALETAMAAALLAMVANLTVGKKRYEHAQDDILRIRETALSLLQEARDLVDEDADAYRAVADALSLPRTTDGEKSERAQRVQEALKEAVSPPLRTMRLASQVVELAADLVEVGNRSAVSDVGTAVLAARAGYDAARLNVDINLHSVRDEAWVETTRAELASIQAPDPTEQKVMERTNRIIRGEAG